MRTRHRRSWGRLLLALGLSLAPVRLLAEEAAVAPLDLGEPLIAHWDFDEVFGGGCSDVSGNGRDAAPERTGGEALRRVPGVFGAALSFSGSHLLRVPGQPNVDGLKALSLSAWVLPARWDQYNEIFRKEDGDNRVLFSFQHEGSILSLGLNVNGYVECDAKIDPRYLLDGRWHHCAATFDSEALRVYLDGREIGSLSRPGAISAGGPADGCLGSSNGGENFQGAMDELRIYREALSPEEIAKLHDNGRQALARQEESAPADEPVAPHPLLAHWTFNEDGRARIVGEASGEASGKARLKVESRALRTRGVHGNALSLLGEHALATKGGLGAHELSAITFSAWAKPTDLSGFRELFRQESGNRRLLFSFQENGTILSLGLNVNGYEECDAKIDPTKVADGRWHHCAATFDGSFMRVFLDGREVGSLERPGTIATRPNTPGFIGSSGGESEHFQGSLDDLRIYRAALTGQEIARLHEAGTQALDRFARQLEGRLGAVYSKRSSFAETLAASRRRWQEGNTEVALDMVEVLRRRIRSDFPEDCANFAEWTGADPLEYLARRDDQFQTKHAERLVGLLTEYRPLTPSQKARQTPDEREKWAEATALEQRLQALKARGEAARFAPGWVEIMLEAGRRIEFRPYRSEAVAPYRKPETPLTRDLTPAEARETLERDWLHQADGSPTPARVVAEITWTRELAERLRSESLGELSFSAELARLDAYERQARTLTEGSDDLYFRVRSLKRRIAFRNPVVDFDSVLFVDMPFPAGSEWPHETRHRLGYMAVPGGRLLTLTGLSPEGKLTQLMPQPPLHGSFWRPDLSFEATRVLFCFKPHNEKSFHLYEINLDGTGLTQLTDGPYDDLDPIYLPDGEHLLFSTTRAHTYVRCMPPTNAYVLARCDRDGRNVYLVSANNEPDYLPSVMDDGRILYTRWEYTDKPLWRAMGLWTINPDGTHVSTFWGNQTVWPDLLKDARSIPGSRRVMLTGSAHHNWFSGAVAIIDPARGFNFPDGLTKVTADVAWPEVGNGPVDPVESPNYHSSGTYSAYYSPYPLSERDFLVSANRGGKFVLYLMDVDGNRELIYEGAHNILHALPVRPRKKPNPLNDTVVWPDREHRDQPKDGVLYSGNIYEGAPEVLKGKAAFLRVLHIEPKTYTYWHKRPYISTGPVVSIVQSEGVKRVLGTVPLETDGSIAFRAPPGKALHFQLLDEQYRALQTMRSFVSVMPGEKRGCLGCHELHSKTPAYKSQTLALSKEPQTITPPPWGEATVSYDRFVQPVLDRYCGSCHQGRGEARKALDLTRRPGYLMFDEPYVTLTGKPTWGQAYQQPADPPPGWGIANTLMVEAYEKTDPEAYQTPEPMTRLSYRSKLVEIASSGTHHGVRVDELSRRKLIAWVDTMCPYRGDEEVRQIPDPDFQGVDWLAVRPRIATAPRIVRPGPVD